MWIPLFVLRRSLFPLECCTCTKLRMQLHATQPHFFHTFNWSCCLRWAFAAPMASSPLGSAWIGASVRLCTYEPVSGPGCVELEALMLAGGFRLCLRRAGSVAFSSSAGAPVRDPPLWVPSWVSSSVQSGTRPALFVVVRLLQGLRFAHCSVLLPSCWSRMCASL